MGQFLALFACWNGVAGDIHTVFETEKNQLNESAGLSFARRRPTLTGGRPPTTIGAGELDFRVRDGNGYILSAVATGHDITVCDHLRISSSALSSASSRIQYAPVPPPSLPRPS